MEFSKSSSKELHNRVPARVAANSSIIEYHQEEQKIENRKLILNRVPAKGAVDCSIIEYLQE